MRGKAQLPSKTHSCSELATGSKKLMEVKREAEKEEDLKKQIKDRDSCWYFLQLKGCG